MDKADYANLTNLEYIEEAYQRWSQDADSVEPTWAFFFQGFELGKRGIPLTEDEAQPGAARGQWQIDRLIYYYRDLGHLLATIDPLNPEPKRRPELELSSFGFSESDLDVEYGLGSLYGPPKATLREILQILHDTYCGTVGVEYMHIQNPEQRKWIQERLESTRGSFGFSEEKKMRILRQILRAEFFEAFVHKKFLGQKRFSLEGAESLIALLDTIRELAPNMDIVEMVLGMPHRGRLNVLANIVDKSFESIFGEFEDNYQPDMSDGAGDVKYHKGYSSDYLTSEGKSLHISLSSNPSHLEAVNPVTVGRARGKQRQRNVDRQAVMAVLIHGDAAIAGQGLVMETLQLSQLPGYGTGGTMHIVVDNQIGFTTDPEEGRSTRYPTDIAKMFGAPVFHVNGNDPEAVAFCTQLCMEFRQTFGVDTFLNLVCYRKYGHNEADEPAYTQPQMYAKIRKMPAISKVYIDRLVAEPGVSLDDNAAVHIKKDFEKQLDDALKRVRSDKHVPAPPQVMAGRWQGYEQAYSAEAVDTRVSLEELDQVVAALFSWPEGFNLNHKIAKQLEQKKTHYFGSAEKPNGERGSVDWAMAEALAIGSLLIQGTPVRLSGQDSRRGTFSQRHSVLFDSNDGSTYVPLNDIKPEQAKFCVYNSPLSEAAVLGFDYGYSLVEPEMLVMWEAQFGDFVNGAQVIIDQFITSGEAKWHRSSGIVLLLPHGHEGMGPEHSSAKPERFLQACAQDNIQVCNPSTPAQYFHLLRRQMRRNFRKPLIVMTPKSLLRHKSCVSTVPELTDGGFNEILEDLCCGAAKAKRLLLCSGKIFYDLLAYREENKLEDVTIVRLEQIYPWPQTQLVKLFNSYTELEEYIWVQEEPQNMGAWRFVAPRLAAMSPLALQCVGRKPAASPATGSYSAHKMEQEAIVERAFSHVGSSEMDIYPLDNLEGQTHE